MVDINVNRLVTNEDLSQLSGSISEHGKDAAQKTWKNSLAASTKLLKNDAEREAVRSWAGEFGSWSDAEIKAWSNAELDALVLQYAAGDLREAQALAAGDGVAAIDWEAHDKLSKRGTIGGNLYPHDGKLWISLG